MNEALQAFVNLNDYLDSNEQTQAILDAIKRRDYSLAEEMVNAFQFEQAHAAFKALQGYMDSNEKMLFCERALVSIDRTITLPDAEVSIYTKGKHKLIPTVMPITQNAPTKTVLLFKSSDESVAKIDKYGSVTGIGAGSVYISFSAQDNPFVGGRLLIHVLTPVTKLTLDPQKLALQLSSVNQSLGTANLSFSYLPESAAVPTIEWSSSNTKVATVNQEGTVLAVGIGQARITATSYNTSGLPVKSTSTVTVTQAVESVTITDDGKPFYIGKIQAMKATLLPKQAANKKLTWTSSDTNIATVSADGNVKDIAQGTVTISAQSASGITATKQIQVEVPPTFLRVSASAKLISNNHVGSRWTKEFRITDIDFTSSTRIGVKPGQSVDLFCWITENDSRPDVGMFRQTIEITEELIKNGLTFRETVYVRENNGRYSGYSAEWEVTIKITK